MKYRGWGKVWEVSAGQTKEFQSESDNFLIFQCRGSKAILGFSFALISLSHHHNHHHVNEASLLAYGFRYFSVYLISLSTELLYLAEHRAIV